ncbi:MAG: TolC family protein, partial [Thiohalomonadaceae bacterium]
RKRIEVTQSAIAQAEENLRVVRDRYANGLSTNTEVLDAETLRVNSEANHAAALYDAALAGLRLKRAVGEL